MNEYQADRSLSARTTSNIISCESTDPMRDILQCPLCVFVTSNRLEFTEHLISHYSPKRNKSVLAHVPVFKSSLNQDGDNSPFTLTEYKHDQTDGTDESSFLRVSHVNLQSDIRMQNRRRGFRREAKNCKQCNFIAGTKMEYWEHMRCHIKGFTCSECSFVTKYKHHMNHHWLSVHDGSKPFKCKKCLYTCVSKSMLTSHLKKHSNIYPYRCADCTYKTKFCNALKKHLRTKEHMPAIVLNADGSPNPLSIVDVYGTKRGPKRKPSKESVKKQETSRNADVMQTTNANKLDSTVTDSPSLSIHSIAHYLTLIAINGINNGHRINDINKNNQFVTMFPYSDLVAAFNLSNRVPLHEDTTFADENVQKTDHAGYDTLTQEYAAKMFAILNAEDKISFVQNRLPVSTHFDTINNISESHTPDSMKTDDESFVAVKTQLEHHRIESTDMPLDLRVTDVIKKNQFQFQALADTTNLSKISNKRKGKAIKLEHLIKDNINKKSEQNKRHKDVSSDNESPLDDFFEVNHKSKIKIEAIVDLFDAKLTCQYCDIIFSNMIMYAVHMGCHSFNDPYTCNICGHRCIDKLSFFLHIAQSEH